MSTFSGDGKNAKAAQLAVDKDKPTAEQIKQADETVTQQAELSADNPNEPAAIVGESASEAADRHIASTELPVGEVTDPDSQDDGPLAEDAKDDIVAGAATGPDKAGVVRNDHGRVAAAPPGSMDAALNGVQHDAAGHVDSVGTDNTSRSGSRA